MMLTFSFVLLRTVTSGFQVAPSCALIWSISLQVVLAFVGELVAADVDAFQVEDHVADGALVGVVAGEELGRHAEHGGVERDVDHLLGTVGQAGEVEVDPLRRRPERRRRESGPG